jgi:succinoglycan biosynthesis transport protein ExoP
MSSLVEVNPYPLAEQPAEASLGEASERRRETNLLALAWRNRWLLLLTTIIGGTVGWVLLERVTPRFTSLSRIYVERGMPSFLLQDQLQPAQSTSYLYTQAELIRSTPVLSAASDATADLETFREVDSRVTFLREKLDVSVGTNDEIINVSIELPSAEDAAQIVNAVVEAYCDKYSDQRRTSAADILTVLRTDKERRDNDLKLAREALDEFRTQHPEVAVRVSDGDVVTLKFKDLTQSLSVAEMDLLEAKTQYNQAKKMYETPTLQPFLLEMAYSEQQAMREIELERQIQEVRSSLTAERARWGNGHPSVKLQRTALTELEDQLKRKQASTIDGYVETLRLRYELLQHKHDDLRAQYDTQFTQATIVGNHSERLALLLEAYNRAVKASDVIDDRMKEVSLTENVGDMQVEILETGGVAEDPSFPSRPKFLAAGILLGGLGGFGLAWLRDLLDHRLKSVDEVAEILQLPVLGVVPQTTSTGRSHVGRLVAEAPRCQIAEAVRTLRTALHFGLAGHDAKVLAVTSPSPGDGKSTITSNLAIALAQADQRVLLIDADLRKPTQHLIFEVSPEHGLGSVLTARSPVAEAIVPSGVEGLDLLPCGPLPANPVELLNNGFFAEMLEELKGRYDKIVIDAPPVMPVADARIIAAVADATVIVLRALKSSRRLSLATRNELWRVRAKRLGVVVNGMRRTGSFGYGYGYGYGKYGHGYGGYGQTDSDRLPSSRRKKSRSLPAPATTASTDSPAAAAVNE